MYKKRPKVPSGQRDTLSIRLTKEERALLEEVAYLKRSTLSAFIIECCMARANAYAKKNELDLEQIMKNR